MRCRLSPVGLRDSVLASWRTNNLVNVFLIEHLDTELWNADVPGLPRRTIRMLGSHLHNARCRWIKTLGEEFGIRAPGKVDRYSVDAKDLVYALEQSSRGILDLLVLGCEQGGTLPASSAYAWRNLPLDVGHVVGYFIAHEAHHRGQIVMAARQSGHRLPPEVTGGLWQWSKLSRNVK